MAVAAAAPAGPCVIFPGDCVEIFGLSSRAGQELNGCNGIATKRLDNGRFEVRIGVEKRVTVKPENLRLHQKDVEKKVDKLGFGEADHKAEIEAAGSFRPGELVEIGGLSSIQREVNGKTGVVVDDPMTPPDRVKVRVEIGLPPPNDHRHVTVRPGNLKRVYSAGLTGDTPSHKLKNGGDTAQDNIARARLNRLSAQERGTGKELFHKVELAVAAPEEEGVEGLRVGDLIEVQGLTSEAGQLLNGQAGVVTAAAAGDDRAEVRLAVGLKRLKPGNLKRMDFAAGARPMVEVHSLTSEAGRAMNGSRGVVTARNQETGRFDVTLSDKTVALKPDNLWLLQKKEG